jgi:phenylpropionate dioxygenase-like ring-hydroxylating dioxygenase large terminal subunit
MAGALRDSKLSTRPSPTYQELLELEKRPVPAALRENYNDHRALGNDDIDVNRYLSRDFYQREIDRMWSRVWQMACRVEEIPNVGDYVIYNVADYSLIVVRSAPNQIKAYHNACLHRGRMLCENDGRVRSFRCRFHGFTWDLEGKLTFVPGRWDFEHVRDANFSLPEAKVGTWGGFVFVNMDPRRPDR